MRQVSLPTPNQLESAPTESVSGSRFLQVVPRLQDIDLAALRWRGWLGSVPALMLLGLAAGVANLAPPQPLGAQPAAVATSASIVQADWEKGIIPLHETMVVAARTRSQAAVWQGELMPSLGVVGKAPISGQVSRVWVKPGENVNVGDPILELSSGSESRGPLPVERKQAQAEQAQVTAAQQQAELQAKMQKSQAQLHEAQLRVAAAQRRVAEARDVLEEARKGVNTAATSPRSPASTASQPDTNSAQAAARSARDQAARDVREVEASVLAAARKAAAAGRAADAADRDLAAARQKLLQARQRFEEVQNQFDTGAAKGSDVEIARGAVEDAQAAVQSATSKAGSLREEARAAMAESQPLQQKAEQAQQRYAESVQRLNEIGDAPAPRQTPKAPAAASASPSAPRRSVEEAAKIVRAAVADSQAAIARAEKIKKEAQSYENQVKLVNERMNAATQQLEIAQQRVIENTILAKLSVVRAPASGRVLSVAQVAANVSPGANVVAIGEDNRLKVYFKDTSGHWKNLQPDQRLPVTVLPAAHQPDEENAQPNSTSLSTQADNFSASGVTVSARIDSIEPPQNEGEPAVIMALVHNPAQGVARTRTFRPGQPVICRLQATAADSPALFVPEAAVMRQDDLVMAAVLSPTPEDDYNIQWRMLKLGKRLGAGREVLDGLEAGERIVLQPARLYNYSRQNGEAAKVQLITS